MCGTNTPLRVGGGRRDALRSYLAERNIGRKFNYPISDGNQQRVFRRRTNSGHNGFCQRKPSGPSPGEVLNPARVPSLTERSNSPGQLMPIGSFYHAAQRPLQSVEFARGMPELRRMGTLLPVRVRVWLVSVVSQGETLRPHSQRPLQGELNTRWHPHNSPHSVSTLHDTRQLVPAALVMAAVTNGVGSPGEVGMNSASDVVSRYRRGSCRRPS